MVINSIAGVAKADVTVLKEDSNRILGINTTDVIYHDKGEGGYLDQLLTSRKVYNKIVSRPGIAFHSDINYSTLQIFVKNFKW